MTLQDRGVGPYIRDMQRFRRPAGIAKEDFGESIRDCVWDIPSIATEVGTGAGMESNGGTVVCARELGDLVDITGVVLDELSEETQRAVAALTEDCKHGYQPFFVSIPGHTPNTGQSKARHGGHIADVWRGRAKEGTEVISGRDRGCDGWPEAAKIRAARGSRISYLLASAQAN